MTADPIFLPNRALVEEQATAWLAAIDRGLNDIEKNLLDEWLSQSPLHGEVLVHYAGLWDKMDILSAVAKVLPLDPDSKKAVFVSSSKPNKRILGALASAAAALFIAVLIWLPQEQAPDSGDYFRAVYQTAIGDQTEVALPDGSRIKLNTNSEIHVRFSAKQREVSLKSGEAYFDVAPNKLVPFVAKVDQDAVVAVGTAFNIQRHDEGFELLVTEGTVRLEYDESESSPDDSGNDVARFDQAESAISGEDKKPSANIKSLVDKPQEVPQFLSGGSKAVVMRGKPEVSYVSKARLNAQLAWHNGMLVFQGETLDVALEEINRYSKLQLIIEDPELSSIEVGGYFRAGDSDQLLMMLEHNFGITSRREGSELLLSRL